MGMGIVSDSELQKELNNSGVVESNTIPPRTGNVIDMPGRGRGTGNVEVPDSLRKIIGETSELEGRQDALALARQFGISDSSVSAYANGSTSTSTYDKKEDGILNHINERKGVRTKSALAVMKRALSKISDAKLETCDAKELSSVAKDMASVVKLMEPEAKESEGAKRPQFVVFAPVMRDESHFEVIHAKE